MSWFKKFFELEIFTPAVILACITLYVMHVQGWAAAIHEALTTVPPWKPGQRRIAPWERLWDLTVLSSLLVVPFGVCAVAIRYGSPLVGAAAGWLMDMDRPRMEPLAPFWLPRPPEPPPGRLRRAWRWLSRQNRRLWRWLLR